MAGSIKGITIEIGGDATPLKKALSDVEESSKKLKDDLKNVNNLLKLDPTNVELAAQKHKLLSESVSTAQERLDRLKSVQEQVNEQFASGKIDSATYEKFNREVTAAEVSLQKAKNTLSEYDKEQEKANSATNQLREKIASQKEELSGLKDRYADVVLTQGKNSEEARNLEKQMDSLNGELQENEDRLSEVEQAADEAAGSVKDAGDKAEKSESGWKKLGSALAEVGKVALEAVAAATAAVIGFAKESIDTTAEFDSSMSQIAATMGMTTDDIKNNVGGAGDTFQALRDKALEMGSETNFSASQAAEGLNILAMSGYDAADSMGMIEDVLHLAAAGAMEMSSAAGYISGAMKGFNDETKDSSYYADLMAKGATLANTSVTQLGEAIAGGAAGAAAYGQEADSMTVALLRLAEQGVTGSAAATAMSAAMKNLYTPTDQAAAALEELGVAAYENGQALDFNDIVNNLSDALSGYSDEQANAYKQTIFGIQGLDAFNKMTVTSEEKQKEWAQALSEASGEASRQYSTMTDNLQGDIDIWNSALDGFKISIGDQLMPTVREFVKFGSDSMSELTSAFKEGGLDGLMSALGEVLSNLISMLSERLPEWIEAGMSLLSSLGQGIMDNLPQLMDAATQIILSLTEFIIQALPDIVRAGLELILTLAQGIGEALPELIPTIVEVILEIVDTLTAPNNIELLLDAAIAIILGLAEGIINSLPKLAEKAPEIIANLVEAIIKAVPKLLEAGVKLLETLVEGIFSAFDQLDEVGEKIVETLAGVWESVKEAWAEVKDWFGEKFEGARDTVQEAWQNVGDWFSERKEDVQNAFENIGDWFGEKFEGARDTVQEAWQNVGSWFEQRKEDVHGAWETIDTWMSDKFGGAWDGIKKAFEPFVDFFREIWETVKEIFSVVEKVLKGDFEGAWNGIKGIWDKVTGFFRDIWDGIKNIFSNVGGWFKDKFSEAVNGIKSIFTGLINSAVSWGSDLVNNFIGGIKNVWGGFTSTLSDLAGTVTSFIGFSEPEKGPLSNFHTYAPDMMQLFIKGIKDNEKDLKKAMSDALEFDMSGTFRNMQGKLSAVEKKLYSGYAGAVTNNNTTSLGGISVVITGSVGSVAEASSIGNEIAEKIQRNLRYKGVTAFA